ncbi:MAG: methionyl-tRNA formyltransferase [Pseudarcicella sp.]|nr:methionyl-tRNA formyltransferase [Pseudarcicella sp.]
MGTPEFAVESLKVLVENNCNVVGVVTAPDKPIGRGLKMGLSAVKEFSLINLPNVPILQPEKLKDEAFLSELKSLQADLQIVVAFRMLPEVVWNMPPKGTFNLHGSLLPNYRGAAPINWAIINGEKETGVTTFFLKHEIDTGSIIFQEKETININDNVGDIYQRLMIKGAQLVLKTVNAIAQNTVEATPQTLLGTEKHAPKIFKETCEIDWNKTRLEVHNFIRGLSPYPGAWTLLNGKVCKVYQTSLDSDIKSDKISSEMGEFGKCIDGFLQIEELQLEGKKRMNMGDFARGYRA